MDITVQRLRGEWIFVHIERGSSGKQQIKGTKCIVSPNTNSY